MGSIRTKQYLRKVVKYTQNPKCDRNGCWRKGIRRKSKPVKNNDVESSKVFFSFFNTIIGEALQSSPQLSPCYEVPREVCVCAPACTQNKHRLHISHMPSTVHTFMYLFLSNTKIITGFATLLPRRKITHRKESNGVYRCTYIDALLSGERGRFVSRVAWLQNLYFLITLSDRELSSPLRRK